MTSTFDSLIVSCGVSCFVTKTEVLRFPDLCSNDSVFRESSQGFLCDFRIKDVICGVLMQQLKLIMFEKDGRHTFG